MKTPTPYLYFYSEEDKPPALLSIAISFALYSHKKLILATTNKIFDSFPDGIRYSKKIQFFEVQKEQVYNDNIIKTYIDQINRRRIKSNHPPTEVHCIYRWIFLEKIIKETGTKHFFAFDWDTLLFRESKELMISDWDIVMHLDNCDYGHPVFILCPHAATVSEKAVKYYIQYLVKYLELSETRDFLPLYFSDIPPWSSVISQLMLNNRPVTAWNSISLKKGIYCGSNLRDDGGVLVPERTKYYIPPEYNYLPAKETHLSVHNYKFDKYQCMINGKSKYENEWKSWRVAWIHFSGVEGKYILFNYILPTIKNECPEYLRCLV